MNTKHTLVVLLATMTIAAPLPAEVPGGVQFHNGIDGGSLPPDGDPFWGDEAPHTVLVAFDETHNDWGDEFPGFPGIDEVPQSGTAFVKTFLENDTHRLAYDYQDVFTLEQILFEFLIFGEITSDPVPEPTDGLALNVEEDVFNDSGMAWIGYVLQIVDADIYTLCDPTICEEHDTIIHIGTLDNVTATDIGFASTVDLGVVTIEITQATVDMGGEEVPIEGPIVTINFEFPLPYNAEAPESFHLDLLINYLGLPNHGPPPDEAPTGYLMFQYPIPIEGSDPGCVLTQGFWKNHEEDWPVDELTLGNNAYSQAELLDILHQPVHGHAMAPIVQQLQANGLVSLAHQLIAAKLNIAGGAAVPDDIADAIDEADALIADLVIPPIGDDHLPPNATSELNDILDQYNNGVYPGGPPHCDDQGGGQGCSSSDWIQAQRSGGWNNLAPGDSFDKVFGVRVPGPRTLRGVLRDGGGKVRALKRQALTALLNARSPDVDYSLAEAAIIDIVQRAFTSRNFESAIDLLESQNATGCPFDNSAFPH